MATNINSLRMTFFVKIPQPYLRWHMETNFNLILLFVKYDEVEILTKSLSHILSLALKKHLSLHSWIQIQGLAQITPTKSFIEKS